MRVLKQLMLASLHKYLGVLKGSKVMLVKKT